MLVFVRNFLIIICLLPGMGQAATITETWSFSAHFHTQNVNDRLPFLPQTSTTDGFLIEQQGMQVGEIYQGALSVEYASDGDVVSSVSCLIGLYDCALAGNNPGSYFMQAGLRGAEAFFQLGIFASQSSLFHFGHGGGTYTYADDFGRNASTSSFSLTDVAYEISAVPLPTSLPLLAFGLGGLMLLRRRKARAA